MLLTLTERMTRKQIIRIIPFKTADAVQHSLNNLFTECGSLYTKVFKSFTADNGMIRRFISKGRRIKGYAHKAIIKVQNWCNSLLRKILGYLTPDQEFED